MDKNAPLVLPKLNTDQQYAEEASKPGVLVLDVFAKFAGPCEAMLNVFKRLKAELAENIRFAQAQADDIQSLESYRNRSIPTFLIIHGGVLVNMVRGANSPLIESIIREQVERYKSGTDPVPMDGVTQIKINKQLDIPAAVVAKKSAADLTGSDHDVTLALIKPDAYLKASVIIEVIRQKDFNIEQEKHFLFTKEQAQRFYSDHREKPFFASLVKFMTSGPVMGLVLSKSNAVQEWRNTMGPTNARRAKEEAPQSLRALFGTDGQRNAVHGSDSASNATKEIGIVFDENVKEISLPFSERNNEPARYEQSLLIIQPELITVSGEKLPADENLPIPFIDSFAEKTQEILNNVLYVLMINNLSVAKAETIVPNLRQASLLFWDSGASSNEKIENLLSGPVVLLLVAGDHAVPEVQRIAKMLSADNSVNDIKNGFYAPESSVVAYRQVDLFFPYSGTAALNPASARPVEKTVAIIKPDIVKTDRVEQLVKVIKIHGLEVISTREVTFTPEKVAEFYKEHVSKPYFRNLVDFLTSAPAIVLILEGPDAIIKWRTLMGPGDSEKAREMAPNSIRALFGSNVLENAVYGSDSAIIASRDIDLFFNDGTAAKAAEEQERERLAAETAAQVSKLEEKISASNNALKAVGNNKSTNKLAISSSKDSLKADSGSQSTSVKGLSKSKPALAASSPKLVQGQKGLSSTKLSDSRPATSSGKMDTPSKSLSKTSVKATSKPELTTSKPVLASATSRTSLGGPKSAPRPASISKKDLDATSKARLGSNKSVSNSAEKS